MNRAELQVLAEMRLEDAIVLLEAGRWSAAYYLAGYAVECALKAIIASSVQAGDLPDRRLATKVWSHDLPTLLRLAAEVSTTGLRVPGENDPWHRTWILVAEWDPERRYANSADERDVANFLQAINDPVQGVLPWLKCHW